MAVDLPFEIGFMPGEHTSVVASPSYLIAWVLRCGKAWMAASPTPTKPIREPASATILAVDQSARQVPVQIPLIRTSRWVC